MNPQVLEKIRFCGCCIKKQAPRSTQGLRISSAYSLIMISFQISSKYKEKLSINEKDVCPFFFPFIRLYFPIIIFARLYKSTIAVIVDSVLL